MQEIAPVLDFWFAESAQARWFDAGPAFDRTIRQRFAGLVARAAAGELDHWQASASGCLALCILLDQMPRNMFRGDRRAFATDFQARAVAEHALANGFDQALPVEQRQFLYLPFMHSERLADQLRCLALYDSPELRQQREHAADHVDIIRRFGRFPHRNAVLGRTSTAAEAAFLREHKGFGQSIRPPEGSDRGADAGREQAGDQRE